MENSSTKQFTAFIMEIIDKMFWLILEAIIKINLNTARLVGASLVNLLLVCLFMLVFATSCWWCALGLLFIGLQAIGFTISSAILSLLALNLTFLLAAIMAFTSLRKKLLFLN